MINYPITITKKLLQDGKAWSLYIGSCSLVFVFLYLCTWSLIISSLYLVIWLLVLVFFYILIPGLSDISFGDGQ
jgi:hypothetical protein